MSLIAPTQLSQEKFAQREPLTVRLRGLVRSYPKGVGLIQEFLQNADDAGARSLRVFFDNRSYPAAALPATPMAALQGPALVVINDALFSESDWNNIQQIGESGKALDATKTGRFGLGFNSVYNVTDFPMLLTGSRIGIFDPHGDTVAGASAGHPGNAWRLDPALWSLCPDLLAPFLTFGLHLEATEFPVYFEFSSIEHVGLHHVLDPIVLAVC
jgi:sacsin